MKSQMHFQLDSKKTVRVGDKWPASHQFQDQFHGLPLLHKTLRVNIPLMPAETAQLLEERRAFAIAAQAIREEEKARLARELHDELAQSLTALKMDAIWVRDHASSVPGRVIDKLTEMVEMLDRTVAATRRMAADLRPLMLDDLGLVPAIEWLASSFMQRCGVPCTLSVNDEPALELPEPYATAVFRIVQESLNNIAKHAAASQVIVTLDKTLDTVRLRVEDDGCGFVCKGMRKPQSLGLLGLRERAQLLGGSVAIRSARGKGTTVEVSIPLHEMGVPQ
ncbi:MULTISPECIES: sensor histidine kinase [unclassified Polaromonas]|uniref:sensor histidine kinase n=1 Tax=unclassified Polaromonas TaxID=2638319 RepID=UPI001A28AD21|nr:MULTISPECIES: sensor histidine kinase [unclassified Polaromonas]MBG6071018.1 signal transduction histidine kinase [Polaromonas sp. CG_9.7]MBG6112672.1 signal transduction histidine kinase [Polaromonas sp. CG_9.2]MDH6186147.1 signal transduction histidine kinase [Polaromonas sp. CG_23.6]